jgi:hypothetical protein
VLPPGSPEKSLSRETNKGGRRQTLLAAVIPPLPVKTNGKKRRISASAADSARREAKNSDLPTTNVPAPASGVKRKAKITVEVPPLPVD